MTSDKNLKIAVIFIIIALMLFVPKSVFASEEQSIPKLKITLNNTDLETINAGSKDIKYKGNTVELINTSDESYSFREEDVEIKGRGNFSWGLQKKSYQIKFDSKVNVLGMGKAKKWVLIANHADVTLMRNKLIYGLAEKINMPYTCSGTWVDLYIDEEYQGNYLLSEKVEIGSTRVDLEDDYGVVVEMDNNYYASEDNYFKTNLSEAYFVLDESVADDVDEENSVALEAFSAFETYLNEFESLLYSENKDWDKISSKIDVESFIKFYFIQELSANPDGCRTSVFMYKDGANDVLHLGPVWDFDLAVANCNKTDWGYDTDRDYIANIKRHMEKSIDWYTQLFKIPEFRQEVVRIYNEEIKEAFLTATNMIDENESLITESAKMNLEKWNLLGKDNLFGTYRGHTYKNTYKEEVELLHNWVEERVEYLNKRYSNDSDIVNIDYCSNIQNQGWEADFAYSNGEQSGTTGKALRMDNIKINLDTFNSKIANNAKVKYQVHVQNIGWMDWVSNGEIAGAIDSELRIEAIKIELEGLEDYSVEYRVHVQDIGWMDWVYDGEIAGTTGKALRMEAIEIRLTDKKVPQISYNAHIQNDGWEADFLHSNGELSGSADKALRMEAIKIKLVDAPSTAKVTYKAHVQNIGWMDWVSNGEIAGTTGQALRMEAIQIKLEGLEGYSIQYRAYVHGKGWMDWVSNGEIAGTTGQSLSIEAIQIKLVKD